MREGILRFQSVRLLVAAIVVLVPVLLPACGTVEFWRPSTADVSFLKSVQRIEVADLESRAGVDATMLQAELVSQLRNRCQQSTGGQYVADSNKLLKTFRKESGMSGPSVMKLVAYAESDPRPTAFLTGSVHDNQFNEDEEVWVLSASFEARAANGAIKYAQRFDVTAADESDAARTMATYIVASMFNERFLVASNNCRREPGDEPAKPEHRAKP